MGHKFTLSEGCKKRFGIKKNVWYEHNRVSARYFQIFLSIRHIIGKREQNRNKAVDTIFKLQIYTMRDLRLRACLRCQNEKIVRISRGFFRKRLKPKNLGLHDTLCLETTGAQLQQELGKTGTKDEKKNTWLTYLKHVVKDI